MELTDKQWIVLEPLIPELSRWADGRGRPWNPPREVLIGILWVLRTGALWEDMPDRHPPYQICHRRLQQWAREGPWTVSLWYWPKTQDSRPSRCYKRPWEVERLFTWLGYFRRLVVIYEHKIENFPSSLSWDVSSSFFESIYEMTYCYL